MDIVYHFFGDLQGRTEKRRPEPPFSQYSGMKNSQGAVANARSQFEALSSEAKALVSNYSQLEAAEARLGQLAAESAADQQAQAEAQTVIDAINQFAGQEITLDMRGMIESARAQFEQLSDAAKSKVSNYSALEAAEIRLRELESEPTEGDAPVEG